jgi:hypothetical protein
MGRAYSICLSRKEKRAAAEKGDTLPLALWWNEGDSIWLGGRAGFERS